jgi:hypothetical protein
MTITSKQVPNPTGKGGFQDHPELRSNGHWKKENTISFQYNRFLSMSSEDLKAFANTPDNERTAAMDIAYKRILEAKNSLQDVKEITDRTEGKAKEHVDITTYGESLNVKTLTDEELDERIKRYTQQSNSD